jgi:hypothetical protein
MLLPPAVPCRAGKATNRDWDGALYFIAEEAGVLALCCAKIMMRVACVRKLHGALGWSFLKIPAELSVDLETISKHPKTILRRLRGAKARQGDAPTVGLESQVWRQAESALLGAGIVG